MALERGAAVNAFSLAVSAMGVDWRDLDEDGQPDLLVTALSNEGFLLLRNAAGRFEDAAGLGLATLPYSGWSAGSGVGSGAAFGSNLDETKVPPPSAFVVTINGGSPVAPAAVSIRFTRVRLTLDSPVSAGDSVEVVYTRPATGGLEILAVPQKQPVGDFSFPSRTPRTIRCSASTTGPTSTSTSATHRSSQTARRARRRPRWRR